MKRLFLPCIVCMLFLALVGCNSKEQLNDVDVKQFEAISEIKDGQENIYFITKDLNNSYWNVIKDCMAKEASDSLVNLYYSGSENESLWEAQDMLIKEAVTAGADAIIIAPDDSVKLAETISKVYEQGIPVILIDTTITKENYDVCYMTDNMVAGQQAAMEMLAKLKRKNLDEEKSLQIAIQVGSSGSQTITERLAGFCGYWAENAPEKWSIIDDVKVNNGDVDYAVECAELFFEDYPDLQGVFGCNNGSTVGFCRAIKDNNRTDLTIVGFDFSDEMASLIKDENYEASTVLQRQDEMARLSIEAAISCANGNDMDVKYVDTGILIVNEDNIDTDEVKNITSTK